MASPTRGYVLRGYMEQMPTAAHMLYVCMYLRTRRDICSSSCGYTTTARVFFERHSVGRYFKGISLLFCHAALSTHRRPSLIRDLE